MQQTVSSDTDDASASLDESKEEAKPARMQPLSRKISTNEFLKETSADERSIISQELGAACIFFIENSRPVYLDGFGILACNKNTFWNTHLVGSKTAVRHETFCVLRFEKCAELIAYQRSRHDQIVETAEIAQRIYPKLPLELQLKWNESDLRRLIRGFIQHLAREVVVSGSSRALPDIGCFYSLHNRQGSAYLDWFAGADIFLKPAYQPLIRVGATRIHERPVLSHTWELLEAAYGKPLQVLKVDLKQELRALELDENTQKVPDLVEQVKIAVFEVPSRNNSEERVLIYCSDGIRQLTKASDDQLFVGTEFTVQLAVEPGHLVPGLEAVPLWPKRLICLAWILLESSRSKTLKEGAGLSAGASLVGDLDHKLRTIFVTRFAPLPSEQLHKNGSFAFKNLVLLRDEEAEVARAYGTEHLLALLEHRKLSQIVRLKRPSLVNKSALNSAARLN